MVAVLISDLAYLESALESVAEQNPMGEFHFERLYRTVYNLTISKKTDTLNLLIQTVAKKLSRLDESSYTHASLSIQNIFLFFDKTVCAKRKTSVPTMLDAARRRRAEPPSERRTSKRIRPSI